MAREVSHYICQECGNESSKWSGQCASCKKWNTLVETIVATKRPRGLGRRVRPASSGSGLVKLSEVKVVSGAVGRLSTGIGELDRVLGASEKSLGIVPGSVTLLAGEPGIGKSTLLTQLALRVARNGKLTIDSGKRKAPEVLYVCGEESPGQIKLRVNRLDGIENTQGKMDNLLLLPETNVDVIIEKVRSKKNLGLVIVDSIQTMSTGDLTGMAGSVGQIRESAFRLIEVAKRTQVPLFIVGHVTKGGAIAGPKVLEHMVDVVLSLEGESQHDFRILRGRKNRFGAIDEVGVFVMGESGMEGVKNPSDVFLEEKQKNVPGSVVVATVAGLRPVLIEVQALVVPTKLAIPRRVSTGVDQRKLQLITAVLTKHCRMKLGESDIFVNVVGGLKISEPAIDLGLALAIASGFKNKKLPGKSVVIGEVGLLGEIRRVGKLKQRIAEAKKMGYTKIISPENYRSLVEVVRKVL